MISPSKSAATSATVPTPSRAPTTRSPFGSSPRSSSAGSPPPPPGSTNKLCPIMTHTFRAMTKTLGKFTDWLSLTTLLLNKTRSSSNKTRFLFLSLNFHAFESIPHPDNGHCRAGKEPKWVDTERRNTRLPQETDQANHQGLLLDWPLARLVLSYERFLTQDFQYRIFWYGIAA